MLASFLMLADAVTDMKAPHRVAIERLSIAGDLSEASACAARSLSRKGRVTSYPLSDGFGLDFSVNMPISLYSGGPSYMTYEFHRDTAGAFAKILYRRPFSSAAVIGAFRDTAKICFPTDWNAWAATNGAKALPPSPSPSEH